MINRVSLLSPLPVNQSLYEGVNTSAGLVMLYYNKHKLRNHLYWFNAKQTLIPANHSHHWLQLQRNSNQRLIALARQGIKDKFVTMSCLLNCEEFDSFEFWISWVCMQLSSLSHLVTESERLLIQTLTQNVITHHEEKKWYWISVVFFKLFQLPSLFSLDLHNDMILQLTAKKKKKKFDMCDFRNSVF